MTTLKSILRSSLIATSLGIAMLPSLHAQQKTPVTLAYSINLSPDFVGDFDFFTLDLKRNHLILAGEAHHSLEIFDAKTGKHLQSVTGSGLKTPHTVAYVPEKDELFVGDGGDSSCLIFSGEDFHLIGRIPLTDGSVTGKTDSPDTGYYDEKKHIFYVGDGGKSANLPYSEIAAISVDTHQVVDRIRVEANNLEGMAVDDTRDRLYVNMRDKKLVGVVDLKAKKVVDTWSIPELNLNTPLAVDAATNRVFVVGRKPGLLMVFDAATGKVVQELSSIDIADGINWDAAAKRLYVSGSQGLSIFHQDDKDHMTEIARIPTNGGKTSLLSSRLALFYVAHPKTPIDDAGLLVYRVNR